MTHNLAPLPHRDWHDFAPIARDGVAVACIPLAVGYHFADDARAALTHDEIATQDVRQTVTDRLRFAIGRGYLRQWLAHLTDQAPQRIVIITDEYGKPKLNGTVADWHVNISHAGMYTVIALTQRGAIGVDVARIQPMPNGGRDAARLVCSDEELSHLNRLTHDDALVSFFAIWTRKEAVLKARGSGFHDNARALTMPLHPFTDEPALHSIDTWHIWSRKLDVIHLLALACHAPLHHEDVFCFIVERGK